jgi:hypothetical protein
VTSATSNRIIAEVVKSIDIPDSSYETAERRYKDLAEWFGRPDSRCSAHSPHISSQGSFRLGTVVRPITANGEYDLDVGCRLRFGITTRSHTQEQLKRLVGDELTEYRQARRITRPLEEKRRCWRLHYADGMNFHIDAVPSIPADAARRGVLQELMVRAGTVPVLAKSVSDHAGSITDNTHAQFRQLSPVWRISNSEGFALWFESRIKLASSVLLEKAIRARGFEVADLPAYRWRSPLQTCVQILKRHRDAMFATGMDRAPISVVITTLAAEAYNGEADVADALARILRTMAGFVNSGVPRIPNPVNPAEDFADKWADPQCQHLDLEGNFWRWLEQANVDFDSIMRTQDVTTIVQNLQKGFAIPTNEALIGAALGVRSSNSLLSAPAAPSNLTFPPKPVVPSKPAGFA